MDKYDDYLTMLLESGEEEKAISERIKSLEKEFYNTDEYREFSFVRDQLVSELNDATERRLACARIMRPKREPVKNDEKTDWAAFIEERKKKREERIASLPEGLRTAVTAFNALSSVEKEEFFNHADRFGSGLEKDPEQVPEKNVSDLQHILVQTILDYINDNNLKDIYAVRFSADGLSTSAECGYWTPETDAHIIVEGVKEIPIKTRSGKDTTITARTNKGEYY